MISRDNKDKHKTPGTLRWSLFFIRLE